MANVLHETFIGACHGIQTVRVALATPHKLQSSSISVPVFVNGESIVLHDDAAEFKLTRTGFSTQLSD
uniref:HDC13404 n=1 Tax=Drosophila melanogaster TaxID=7227 RepID=Q6IK47_DROME|nr:TPA_inf: HDC13404 [Drosophila melanogaster]